LITGHSDTHVKKALIVGVTWKRIPPNVSIRAELLELEKSFLYPNHNIGVLYVAARNQTEDEMFSNRLSDTELPPNHSDGSGVDPIRYSQKFNKFLALMGQRIQLYGWKGYSGGLDTKNTQTTGKETVYTSFKGHNIIFHVSTLLPYHHDDTQRLERKRHLGNDILLIVFLEDMDSSFDPTLMRTQFNNVYGVIAVDNSSRVRLEFATKEGTLPYGPRIPPANSNGTNFELNEQFRDFLLTKLLNGERASLQAPVFANRTEKVHIHLVRQLLEKIVQVSPNPDHKEKTKKM